MRAPNSGCKGSIVKVVMSNAPWTREVRALTSIESTHLAHHLSAAAAIGQM
jgi:hypothetical protein